MSTTQTTRPAIWIVMQNPSQMVTAIGLSLYFRDRYTINLVYSKFHYWEYVNFNLVNKYFDTVTNCPNVGISRNLLRQAYWTFLAKRKIKSLNIQKQDIFISLTSTSGLEGILYALHRSNKKIHIFPTIKVLSDVVAGSNSYQEFIYSKIWNNFLRPFFGSLPIICLRSKHDKRLEDTYIYKNGDDSIFSNRFTLVDNSAKNLAGDELCDFSILVRNSLVAAATVPEKRFVLFFGDAKSQESTTPEDIEFVNKCMRYIERFFPNRNYIYKPHPNDRFEAGSITLGKFEVSKEKINAQMLLLKKMASIEACFTVSSTSVRSCINMGINRSYFFLKLQKSQRDDFYNIALSVIGEGVDPSAFIENFDLPPKDYSIQYDQDLFNMGMKKLESCMMEKIN